MSMELQELIKRVELIEKLVLPISVKKDNNVSEDVKRILQAIENCTNYNLYILKTKSRKRDLVDARSMAYALIRENTRIGLKAIGELFGGRDHATVINGLDIHNDLMCFKNTPYYNKFKEIEAEYERLCNLTLVVEFEPIINAS